MVDQQREESFKSALADRDKVFIKKAKLDDGTCHVEFKTTLFDKPATGSLDPGAQVHEDLLNAFKGLVPHLILLGEMAEIADDESFDEFAQRDIIASYGITGFTIGGSGDNEGVSLIGYKLLSNSKQLNLVSPFQKWDTGSDPYDYIDALGEAIELCKHEVIEYLNGKIAPNPQQAIPFEEEKIVAE